MTNERSELSDRGGAGGGGRRAASVVTTSVAALSALGFTPLAIVALTSAVPPTSGEANWFFLGMMATASVAFAVFAIIGARLGRRGGSVGLMLYGVVVAVILILCAVCLVVAAILRAQG
jgi:hypothetical protein